LEGDQAEAARHLAWARGQAREYDLIGAQAQVAAFRGRLQASREGHRQTVARARGSGFPEVGIGYLAHSAWIDALYGNRAEAVAQAREVAAAAKTYAPRLRAAAALALAGATREAQAIVAGERGARPEDTLLHRVYLPIAEAALALAANRPDAALERLRVAAPYERGTVAVLAPAYLRGRAYALHGADADAAREFRAVIDHRGADPFSPLSPLARLELARALGRQGLPDQARGEYDALLTLWSAADADLSPLLAARAERTALP
jgi:eukaryotic-like serine/threonine-protein kinase